jgi:hypothetical protein
MEAHRRFSSLVFWLSYVGFALFWVFVGGHYHPFDLGGTMLLFCAVIFPAPFILVGYFARLVSFSMLYALLVLILSYFMFFHGVPALERFIYPSYMKDEQKAATSR